jgi:hypothetical protein
MGSGKKGGEFGRKFFYVIENIWRKNVRGSPFHDVDEKKLLTVAFPRYV